MTKKQAIGSPGAMGGRRPTAGPGTEPGSDVRLCSTWKMEEAFRVLWAEDLDLVNPDYWVMAGHFAPWQEAFLGAGVASLKSRMGDLFFLENGRFQANESPIKIEYWNEDRPLRGRIPTYAAEAEEMSRPLSPSGCRPFGLVRVCRTWNPPLPNGYSLRGKDQNNLQALPKRRGLHATCSDREILEETRKALKETAGNAEGNRKFWGRLRFKRIRVSQKRVSRLMTKQGLLAKDRPVPSGHSNEHKGTIILEDPNKVSGTDSTSTLRGKGNPMKMDPGRAIFKDYII